MKLYVLPMEMVQALRSWFHPKDRSVILAPATFIEGEEIVTPAHPIAPGSPAHNRGRLYWKNGYWTSLDENGDEQILPGLALITETILSASATSVTFSGIPQIFRHLWVICQIRTDRAAEIDAARLRCNGDTSASYDEQHYTANSTTISAAANRAATSMLIGATEAANSRANNFGQLIIEILDYTSATTEKRVLSRSAAFGDVSADTDLNIQNFAGRWRSATPITSLTLLPNIGPNFVSGSRFQLYGIY